MWAKIRKGYGLRIFLFVVIPLIGGTDQKNGDKDEGKNVFELAVAVAIALFGTTSPAALATTVGVLTEVPVMLTLVKIANHTKY